jgi:hypothetical protein
VQKLAGNQPIGRQERENQSKATLEKYIERTIRFYSPER